MTTVLKGEFDTRRQAEMAIERLVQEYGVDRGAIEVVAAGDDNSVGVERAGSDDPAGAPSETPRDDAPLEGALVVTVTLDDATSVAAVRAAFAEFAAHDTDAQG